MGLIIVFLLTLICCAVVPGFVSFMGTLTGFLIFLAVAIPVGWCIGWMLKEIGINVYWESKSIWKLIIDPEYRATILHAPANTPEPIATPVGPPTEWTPTPEFVSLLREPLTDAERWCQARLGYVVRAGHTCVSGRAACPPATKQETLDSRTMLNAYHHSQQPGKRDVALTRALGN